MIRKAIGALVSLAGLAAIAWVAFFVPLGERTLAQHLERIAGTREAQELGDDVGVASERLEEAVRTKLREGVTADAGPEARAGQGVAGEAGEGRGAR